MKGLPVWADVVLVPLLSLLLAMFFSALVILGIGADPFEAVKTMLVGAVGSSYAWGSLMRNLSMREPTSIYGLRPTIASYRRPIFLTCRQTSRGPSRLLCAHP
jgi:hypothetical protein